MNFGNSLEIIGIVLSLAGGFCASMAWGWKYIIKPTIRLYKSQQCLVDSVEDIKKELTTNGGSSIKDTVNRIDRRQVMIDKRSKAIFYNADKAILRVGYDETNSFKVWRPRADANIYMETSQSSSDIIINTNNGSAIGERLRISSVGTVLINNGGNATPGLSVNADDLVIGYGTQSDETGITMFSTANSGIRFNDNSGTDGAIEYAHAAREMRFNAAGANRLTFGINAANSPVFNMGVSSGDTNNHNKGDRASVKVGDYLYIESATGAGHNTRAGLGYNCYFHSLEDFYCGTNTPSSGDNRPAAYGMAYGNHYFYSDASNTAHSAQAQLTMSRVMEILREGDVKITDGDLVIGTAGHGIDFSATANGHGSPDELLDDYRLLYGGIDSNDVITRLREPNGVIGAIALRMANSVACKATSTDFILPHSQRRLFPYVETTYQPFTDEGFEVPEVQERIKQTIQHLFYRVLGQEVRLNDPEVLAVYDLWIEMHDEGKSLIESGVESTYMTYTCRGFEDPNTGVDVPSDLYVLQDPEFTIRAWHGVMVYLLSDYHFLFE